MREDDLNEGDYDGRTPLHMAAADGNLECVKFLVSMAKVSVSPIDRLEIVGLGQKVAHLKSVL